MKCTTFPPIPFLRLLLVFCNGTKDQPETQDLRLSSSFMGTAKKVEGNKEEEPALECIAHVVNTNYGHNEDLMKKCPKLREYSCVICVRSVSSSSVPDLCCS